MQKQDKTMKGQLTLRNIVMILILCIVYFMLFLPIYQPFANVAIAALDVTWQFYSELTIIIEILPLFVIIMIVLSIMDSATPRYA